MAQTLLIGLGGTGSRVVNNTVKLLHKNDLAINNGEMCCAVLDTNENDYKAIRNSDTGVPVIPTSKPQKICDYFAEYHHLHMETWCPRSPAFMDESMIDGASELRMKSRIAFMDIVESGELDNTLGLMINDVLKNNAGSKIRVMIVSSLSGGTGSGMFIQVALWLRQFLKESQITIRGIFLLPDVFISTLKDIRDNKETVSRHYCNAYAAIRELNAISKIRKNNGLDLPERITLGDLFDSLRDKDSGKPVFDFAFFVDEKNENGVRMNSIEEYEAMVAQLVYMQLYAPMKDDMYSEEDNAFLSFVSNDEPLYGSCGTAKAVYPAHEVKQYCALRAAKDSLTGGWRKIDNEIDALIEEKKQAEMDGIFSDDVIDIRQEFIRLFDEKTNVKADEVGSDRFFLSISKDVKNESRIRVDGKVHAKYSDKVEDFLQILTKQKIDTTVTRYSGTEDYAISAEAFVAADHDKQVLSERIKTDESGLEEALDTFDSKAEEYANSIVNAVFPYSMGDVRASNEYTIYGLLTKPGDRGERVFIHPVAARYVLYKLTEKMEDTVKGIALSSSREDALTGGDVDTLFDNPATTDVTESTPQEFLDSRRKWKQWNEEAFLDDFEGRYAQFIAAKIALCETYEKECLQVLVYRKLIDRVNELSARLDAFFRDLDEAQQTLEKELEQNIAQNESIAGKIVYVYGNGDAKETIYHSLSLRLESSNAQINKSVIDAVYGSVCAQRRPSNKENARYLNMDVVNAFVEDIKCSFKDKISEDPNNLKKINLDIYTALCKADDVEFVKKGGVLTDAKANAKRHREAFSACKSRLFQEAAPFLIREQEQSDNALGTVTTRKKIFWGFSPAVVAACPFIGAELGVNADLQMDAAYPGNELYCYRAVYGLEATYIPKFNELKGGKYYTCYKAVIDKMVQEAEGVKGERALVVTPHLDKNWHRILPYITGGKQKQEELAFFHGFWLALAYGVIRIDKDGNFCIRRNIDSGFGNAISEDIPVLYKNKSLGKTDVAKLIEVLKQDKVFTDTEIPRLEAEFEEELEEMTTYVGTRVLQGLTTKRDELNAASVAVRYHESRKREKTVASSLVGSLEQIAGQLAECYNMSRSDKQLEEAKFRICRKIYDSSKRSKDKAEIFGNWVAAFEKYKIAEDNSAK